MDTPTKPPPSTLRDESHLDEAITAIQSLHFHKHSQKYEMNLSIPQLNRLRSSTERKLQALPLQRRQSLRRSLAQIVMLENVDREHAERRRAKTLAAQRDDKLREGRNIEKGSQSVEDLEEEHCPPELDEDEESDSSRSDEDGEAWWEDGEEIAIEVDEDEVERNQLYRVENHGERRKEAEVQQGEIEIICGRLDELNDLLGSEDGEKNHVWGRPVVDVVELEDDD